MGRRLKRLTTPGKSHTPRCQMGHSQPGRGTSSPLRAATQQQPASQHHRPYATASVYRRNHIRDHHDRAAMRSPAFAHTASTQPPPSQQSPPQPPTNPSTPPKRFALNESNHSRQDPSDGSQAGRTLSCGKLGETGDVSIGGCSALRLSSAGARVI